MPAAADLVMFAAVNMRDVDTGIQGGAIDTLRRLDFTQIVADDDLEVLSAAAGDTTQNVTVEARNVAGVFASETVLLTGTTAVIFTTLGVVNRVLTCEMDAVAVGIVTLRRSVAGLTVRDIPINERGFIAFFRRTESDPASTKTIYAKGFWKNTHATEALTAAQVKQNADPESRITHLLAVAKDESATSTNRLTAPGAADTQDPDVFDDTDKSVSGTDLLAGEAIGVWFEVNLPAADPAHRATYTTELVGNSV